MHLTDKLFTKEQINTVGGMQSYWEEILKRDEPRRSDCCRNEIQTVLSTLAPTQIIHIMNEGMKAINDETLT